MNKRLPRGCVLGLVFLMAALPGAAQGFLDEPRQSPNGFIQVQCDPDTDPECNLPPDNGGDEGQPPNGGPTPPAQREDPLDQDGDGILDAQDQCPALWGQKPNGCPLGDDNATTGYGQTAMPAPADGGASGTGDLTGGSGCLVINEVLWAGTRFSKNHQYIELRNRCAATLRLDGLRLQLVEKPLDPLTVRTTLQLQGTMSPQGYFLLVNNALAVSDVQPDMVADFQLLEAGMAVLLVEALGNRISTANAGNPTEAAWFAGQALREGDSFSMERNEGENAPDEPSGWHTNDGITRFGLDALGDPINGTPRHPNSPAPEGR